MKIREILAKNLKYYRNRKKLSQEKLAFLSELHRTYISSLECGRRNATVDNLEKLASALEIEAYLLIKEEENIDYKSQR